MAPYLKYCVTEDRSWRNGYDTGLVWAHEGRPGGPFVSGDQFGDRAWNAYCNRTRKNKQAWMEGFDVGLETKESINILRRFGYFPETNWWKGLTTRTGTWFSSPYGGSGMVDERVIWLTDNVVGKWLVRNNHHDDGLFMLYFSNEDDYLLYRLTWV